MGLESTLLADIVALTLLIAESDPRQKSLMIRLVLGMLEEGLVKAADQYAAEAISPLSRRVRTLDSSSHKESP